MTVLKQQQAIFVDTVDVDHFIARGFTSRVGHEQLVIQQRGAVDIAAAEWKCKKHTIKLAAMQGLAG